MYMLSTKIKIDCILFNGERSKKKERHNNFSGRLPASIYSIPLEVLDLYNNNFSGRIAYGFEELYEFNVFEFRGADKFFGNVPMWVGENLTRLYGLVLKSNNFSDPFLYNYVIS
ncbi:hypothetical protein OSB04_011205 [Centaurea solstitialis]|uniref:Uncharacterized protein n=1 Tax=Centaurea solstitialis TaxID=347529 RepID=A0AA38TM44_9ASTR|nr:hypothetical protein OSB04_011205 [Centaurea solstitialis]